MDNSWKYHVNNFENVELHEFLRKDHRENMKRIKAYKAQKQSWEKSGQSTRSRRHISGVHKHSDGANSDKSQALAGRAQGVTENKKGR